MAAADETHSAGLRVMRVDRKPGLHVGGRKVAVRRSRPPRARILVPREVTQRPRRFPMDLVDDLLEVGPEQRLQQPGNSEIEANGVEHRLMIGRPLHHPDQRLAGPTLGYIVEEISVTKT